MINRGKLIKKNRIARKSLKKKRHSLLLLIKNNIINTKTAAEEKTNPLQEDKNPFVKEKKLHCEGMRDLFMKNTT